ncbi:ArnT family glycosyltransferase [Legionella septentrionalis]|uniref:Glycosyltransferase family 39 protein n=2 Tax=Legionella TaxID=445 RepID=A0A433JKI7_9GAMM|nr:glycosyltransferase family 39 protein [Legionella septentrionalis]RUQ89012.1 glycosyltransferase family 39 protein [Legionella septentrionalis]RUR11824.1 glycosyltransferase family 39 protein [Legionella septentrionalis]
MMPAFYIEMALTRKYPYLLLCLFSLLIFLPGMFKLPVIDRDEAHFAQATRQMVQTNQYFQIRFQEKTRFQKPPGINWLQAASVYFGSDSNASKIWPYRIPSLLGALFSILLTFFFARRFIGEKAAFLGAALLGSTFLLAIETHMAVIDASLLSSVVLMQGALWIIYTAGSQGQKAPWGWALLFWLAMTYGFVLKGVTPLVGILTIAALCISERKRSWLRGLRISWGLPLFLLLNLAWLLQVNAAENSNYLLQMFRKDLLPKLQGGHESHGKPPLFHLAILPITFWPASLFLWQGAVHAFQHKSQPAIRFLLAWLLPTWIFFELMPTKLPQYVLPTFPAIALLCALAILACVKTIPSRFLRILQVLWQIASFGFAASLLMITYLLLQEFTWISIATCSAVATMSLLCVRLAFKGHFKQAAVAVLCTALVCYPLIFALLLPQLKPIWVARNASEMLKPYALAEQYPVLVVGFAEPSLVFYLNTKQVIFIEAAEIEQYKKEGQLFLVEEGHRAEMTKDQNFCLLKQSTGYNYNKGKWVKLLLFRWTPSVCPEQKIN